MKNEKIYKYLQLIAFFCKLRDWLWKDLGLQTGIKEKNVNPENWRLVSLEVTTTFFYTNW